MCLRDAPRASFRSTLPPTPTPTPPSTTVSTNPTATPASQAPPPAGATNHAPLLPNTSRHPRGVPPLAHRISNFHYSVSRFLTRYPLLTTHHSLSFTRIMCPPFGRIDERHRTAPGNPRRIRAPLLGRQRQRNFRAPLLLRRVLLAGRLSPGKTEFLDRADRHAHRHIWRNGLVPRDFWRRRRGQTRLSPRSLDGLPHSGRCVLSDRFDRRILARTRSRSGSAQRVCRLHSNSSRARHRASKTMRRRHHCPRFQAECSHTRLLDLLHHGEHRRHRRPLRRRLGAHAPWTGKSFSHLRAQRFRDVLSHPFLLPRSTQTGRRTRP